VKGIVMPNRKIKIDARNDGAGGIDFEVDGAKPHMAKAELPKDSGRHFIEFRLYDTSGKKLKFDSGDPIWLGEDCPCPPAAGLNSDQVELGTCSDRSLQLTNGNWGRGRELRYQLNFVADDGSRATCDPVIVNGGGIKT
jgi:hypothetical protein